MEGRAKTNLHIEWVSATEGSQNCYGLDLLGCSRQEPRLVILKSSRSQDNSSCTNEKSSRSQDLKDLLRVKLTKVKLFLWSWRLEYHKNNSSCPNSTYSTSTLVLFSHNQSSSLQDLVILKNSSRLVWTCSCDLATKVQNWKLDCENSRLSLTVWLDATWRLTWRNVLANNTSCSDAVGANNKLASSC